MYRSAEEIASCIRDYQRDHGRFIVVIDGRCGSGKTTAAMEAGEMLGIPVLHMDDYYLQMHQRTPERYAEPGGNVDRERVKEEILIPFMEHRDIRFHRFDCDVMAVGDEEEVLPCPDVLILEGSYSCHPYLREGDQLRIFLDISPQQQLERIRKRNGEEKLQMFISRWIPLEENYFEKLKIRDTCDVIIDTTDSTTREY